ncbi:hypothetical protein N7540_001076 [Penicillium herquei]|nr:hypothetical protein N7540_001076 [Penicillium herquei]
MIPKVSRTLNILASLTRCGSAEASNSVALWPLQTYKSSPIQAPYLNVTKMGQTEPGLIFLTTRDNVRDVIYPAIYSDDGELIWQGPKGSHFALQPQIWDEEPVLVYWEGKFDHGFGYGYISILNSSYDEIHRVTLDCEQQNLVTIYDDESDIDTCVDLHESKITDKGTILAIAINATRADLTSVGGPKDGWIQDGIVYEIDIKTNEIIFRWSIYDHIDELPMSYVTVPVGAPGSGLGNSKNNPWGYPHLNSVAKYGDSYLLSSKFMCGAILVAPNGTVTWILNVCRPLFETGEVVDLANKNGQGQTGGDFNLGLGASFCYQHDVRVVSESTDRVVLSLHNNANTESTRGAAVTTGMVLEVELAGSKNVTLKRSMWDQDDPVFSTAQGNFQSLPNGHVLLGHGAVPRFAEYNSTDALVMRASFGYDSNMESYRAYRSPWVGHPSTGPDAIACLTGDGTNRTTVFMSWNGATDVESWKVYSGSQVKGTAVRNGFETAAVIDGLADGDSVFIEAVGGVGSGVQSATVTVGQGC